MPRSEAMIDLAAIRYNTSVLKAMTDAQLMAVVKADAYGHGLVQSARAAVQGGASWLGVAVLDEALTLRAHGVTAAILSWLWTQDEQQSLRRAVSAGVDIGVSGTWALEAVARVSDELGIPARVHLKIDTGLSRNGCTPRDWPALVDAAAKLADDSDVSTHGIWSHFAYADDPGNRAIGAQLEVFEWALNEAEERGVEPVLRHIANSAALLTLPEAHYDMVRPGIALYGLPPVPGDFGLVPAMTLRAEFANVKRVPAGAGVSYGHEYTTVTETTLADVPLGYADGVPRNASNVGPMQFAGRRFTIAGRVCMDQVVIDLGDTPAAVGDVVTLFGSGQDGEPTATEWADILGTIDYEIVTRIGPRVQRTYIDSASVSDESAG